MINSLLEKIPECPVNVKTSLLIGPSHVLFVGLFWEVPEGSTNLQLPGWSSSLWVLQSHERQEHDQGKRLIVPTSSVLIFIFRIVPDAAAGSVTTAELTTSRSSSESSGDEMVQIPHTHVLPDSFIFDFSHFSLIYWRNPSFVINKRILKDLSELFYLVC